MAKTDLTAQRLRELLHYNPDTGIFTHAKSRQGVIFGTIAGNMERGYLRIRLDKVIYYAHRLAWMYVHGEFPQDDTDHINGNRADNRICNLRPATRAQNMQNQIAARGNGKSGYLGVCWNRVNRKWEANIKAEGRPRRIGLFDNPADAHAAYVAAKKQAHPFFAR